MPKAPQLPAERGEAHPPLVRIIRGATGVGEPVALIQHDGVMVIRLYRQLDSAGRDAWCLDASVPGAVAAGISDRPRGDERW